MTEFCANRSTGCPCDAGQWAFRSWGQCSWAFWPSGIRPRCSEGEDIFLKIHSEDEQILMYVFVFVFFSGCWLIEEIENQAYQGSTHVCTWHLGEAKTH